MARKTHRTDDIFWSVTTQDIESIQHATTDAITLGQLLDTKYPRKAMVKLFDEKLIHVNGHKATPHTEVAVDDEIWIAMAKEKIDHEPIAMDLHILYEDDDLLIVDKPAGVLSGGEKTRLSLATLVASSANVLLLDEPTNNLDPASREEILNALKAYQGAIVMVSHDEGAVEALDPERVLLLPDAVEDLWSKEYQDLISLA